MGKETQTLSSSFGEFSSPQKKRLKAQNTSCIPSRLSYSETMKQSSPRVTIQIHFRTGVVRVKCRRDDDSVRRAVDKESDKRKELPKFYNVD
jgi:hypothetical protein